MRSGGLQTDTSARGRRHGGVVRPEVLSRFGVDVADLRAGAIRAASLVCVVVSNQFAVVCEENDVCVIELITRLRLDFMIELLRVVERDEE